MLSWFRQFKAEVQPEGRLPAGMRVYAVGDVHGRADLLARMFTAIAADAAAAGGDITDIRAVLLGDLVDRGMQSRDVVALALEPPLPPPIRLTVLMGNHERLMLDFLQDARGAEAWIAMGGGATLASYGCPVPAGRPSRRELEELRATFRARVPERHVWFLANCPTQLELGDYLFVHAGIRPGRSLDRQTDTDRLWIRQAFLGHPGPFGKIIVHGHNITPEPDLHPHRIGVDTGAYATGTLTAVVLEATSRRILQVD